MACIPAQVNKVLKNLFQKGELKVDDFLPISSEEREKLLKRYIDEKYVSDVNDVVIQKFKTELSDEAVEKILTKTDEISKSRGGAKKLTVDEWQKVLKDKNAEQWAREYIKLNNEIDNIINPTENMKFWDTVKYLSKEEARKVSDKMTISGKALQGTKFVGNILTTPLWKSVKASFDMSYALRQGFKVLTKDISNKSTAILNGKKVPPSQWKRSFEEAWSVWKNIGSKEKMAQVMDEWKAIYMSHPYYETLIKDGKLAFGVVEEFFPTTLSQKMGRVGNIFKASDEAFTIFSQSARMGLATEMIEKQLAKSGTVTKEQIRAIATFANSVTGRGGLGKLESASGALNKLLFSARFIRSQADTFLMPINPAITQEMRVEARKHLVATLGTIGAMMSTAAMFTEVETDPRSSNFGKAKVGENTWIDLTAGLGSYISLATKQALSQSKSAKTGKITKLNDPNAYKGQTRGDVLAQWAQNKLAPAPGTINTLFLKGKDFKGDTPTGLSVGMGLTIPISLENMIELWQTEEGATIVGAWVADVLGMSSQTFQR